jgi:hypothetical protein
MPSVWHFLHAGGDSQSHSRIEDGKDAAFEIICIQLNKPEIL